MGIPLFFKKLTSDFVDVIDTTAPTKDVARLFLDFNCAIHYCSNELKRTSVRLCDEEFETQLIQECIKYIQELRAFATPSKLVYISIDGVVPMAKITQQRKRRFLSDYKSQKNPTHEWNSNAITPGTLFMKKLVSELEQFAKEQTDIEMIVDNGNGEGEHKICHYIQAHDVVDDALDVIYGLDADLIILAMLSKNSDNTLLLRENVKHTGTFIWMDIATTKKQIVNQFANAMSMDITQNDADHVVKCYVFITFLLGNDFVPHLSYINLRSMGIESLIQAYAEVFEMFQRQEHIIQKNDEINLKFFTAYLEYLSKNEDFAFEQQERKYYSANAYNKKDIENYPLVNKYPAVINSHKAGWRTNYYYYLFEKNVNSDVVSRACAEYVNGLLWMIDYYFRQTTRWYWFYQYDYSPTIVDLSNFVMSKSHLQNETNYDYRRIEAIDQLAMVLPPSNVHLIPSQKHKEIVKNVALGYTHNFPTAFKICTFMKYKLHECGCVGICLNAPILLEK